MIFSSYVSLPGGDYLNDFGPPSTPHLFGIGMVNCEAEQTTPSATWQVTDRPVSWWRLSPMGTPWDRWDCGKARDEVDFFLGIKAIPSGYVKISI